MCTMIMEPRTIKITNRILFSKQQQRPAANCCNQEFDFIFSVNGSWKQWEKTKCLGFGHKVLRKIQRMRLLLLEFQIKFIWASASLKIQSVKPPPNTHIYRYNILYYLYTYIDIHVIAVRFGFGECETATEPNRP